ncbi:MAG: hypothetical protein H7177_09155 [Rhizobacter sp.]|nr:hypothetical protein [Bacteriovorax sp.]
MKTLIIAFSLVPTLSFASIYNCTGAGFAIDITGTPIEMKIVGNGFNTMAQNIRTSATFDTVISANTATPAASLKLTIKDSSFGNPGDSFASSFQVSSAAGVKDFTGLTCIRGNE